MLRFGRMGKSNSDKNSVVVPGGIPRLQGDDLERVIAAIIRTLRSGKPARLPGLGTINPGQSWTFRQEGSQRHDS